MRRIDWLADLPIAHRGLHGSPNGYGQNLVENTLSGCTAAIEHGFAMEVDLQLSADGEAMMFHDDTLDRLTAQSGPVRNASADQLARIPIEGSSNTIARFADLLALVDGRVPLIIELKHQKGDKTYTLAKRAAEVAADYKGKIAFISFDPFLLSTLKNCAPQFLRGIVVDRGKEAEFLEQSKWWQRFFLRNLLHFQKSKFDFISCDKDALDMISVRWMKRRNMQILTWTIHSLKEAEAALKTADQIVFEGFAP